MKYVFRILSLVALAWCQISYVMQSNDALNNALFHAVKSRHYDLIPTLIQKGADVNACHEYCGIYKKTALHFAAHKGLIKLARLLVKCGADVNTKNDSGDTPLHTAIGRIRIMRLLLDNNANPTALNIDGQTPLLFATARGLMRSTILLTNMQSDLDQPCNAGDNGDTALHVATRRESGKIMQLLIDRGANVNAQNQYEETPLHIAAENHDVKGIRLLLDNGANITAQNIVRETALHAVCRQSHNNSKDVIETMITLLGYARAAQQEEKLIALKNLLNQTACNIVQQRRNNSLTPLLTDVQKKDSRITFAAFSAEGMQAEPFTETLKAMFAREKEYRTLLKRMPHASAVKKQKSTQECC